jgi:tetratricopeptide (TPR) repeat protein
LSEFRSAAKEPKAWPRLQRLAEKPLYFNYKSLFKPFGVKPKRLSHELYLNQAKAYLKAGRIEAAHEVCRIALESAPTHPQGTALMARIERKRRLWRQAVRALRRLVGRRRLPRRLR